MGSFRQNNQTYLNGGTESAGGSRADRGGALQGLRAVRAKFPKKKDALLDAVMTKLTSADAKAAKASGMGHLPLVMWRTGGFDASMELILTKLFRGRG